MRVISVDELLKKSKIVFKEISEQDDEYYAVLSHRWESNETTFADIKARRRLTEESLYKARGTAQQAKNDDIRYIWIDTLCIDKDSSSELSESIQSMYRWYRSAKKCYAYLRDVKANEQSKLAESEWFCRGWTLQELLAPRIVAFFDRAWTYMGSKRSLDSIISRTTGIPMEALKAGDLTSWSIAEKMSWAANRVTTRLEDQAYCLLGLFQVHMPLMYGEGENAFMRLQEEIIKDSDDQSIFAWTMTEPSSGLFARSPSAFSNCGSIGIHPTDGDSTPYSMTNRGLTIELTLEPWAMNTYLAYLDPGNGRGRYPSSQNNDPYLGKPPSKGLKWNLPELSYPDSTVCIFLHRLNPADNQYARVEYQGVDRLLKNLPSSENQGAFPQRKKVRVRKYIGFRDREKIARSPVYGFKISKNLLTPVCKVSCSNGFWHDPTLFASFQPGDPLPVLMLDFTRECHGLKLVTLGFDYDFNPLCRIEDSSRDPNLLGASAGVEGLPDFMRESTDWDADLDNHRADMCTPASRQHHHDGIWALRGEHRYGVFRRLVEDDSAFVDPVVRIYRMSHGKSWIWQLSIEMPDDIFANALQKQFKLDWGSREQFQTKHSLTLSERDLKKGDEILSTLYPSPSNEANGDSNSSHSPTTNHAGVMTKAQVSIRRRVSWT